MKFSRPELHADDESSVRSSTVRGNFSSGRRPLGSSSSVLKVPNDDNDDNDVLYHMLRSFFIRSQVAKMRQYATQRQLLLLRVENLQII